MPYLGGKCHYDIHCRIFKLPFRSRGLVSFDTLHIELLQSSFQSLQLLFQSFPFNLEIRSCFRYAEFLGVELDDLRRMICAAMGRDCFIMLGGQGLKVAREFLEQRQRIRHFRDWDGVIRTLQGIFSFAYSQIASLLQRRKRFVDAANGSLVWVDVEVPNGMMYELGSPLDALSCPAMGSDKFTAAGSSSRSILSGPS